MKMSETKPGDIIRWTPRRANDGTYICLILSEITGYLANDNDAEKMPKIVLIHDSEGHNVGDWFSVFQYKKIFNDDEVQLLIVGMK